MKVKILALHGEIAQYPVPTHACKHLVTLLEESNSSYTPEYPSKSTSGCSGIEHVAKGAYTNKKDPAVQSNFEE